MSKYPYLGVIVSLDCVAVDLPWHRQHVWQGLATRCGLVLNDVELSLAAEASVSAVASKLASIDRLTVDMAATVQQCESLIEARLLEAQPRAVDGLESYLVALMAEGVPRALVGQAEQRTVESLLRQLDLWELIDVVVTHDDARSHISLLTGAAARMEVDPQCCLVIECTPGGVMAARPIGAACLAIPTFFPSQLLVDAGADWCTPDFVRLPGLLRPASLMAVRPGTNDGWVQAGAR
jgi:beta-phosphoglucomutase-like phosphatase (HAD superfamily)